MAELKTPPRENSVATIYLNGELRPASEARLPIEDAAVLYGLGFFETFRTSGGRPHQWALHRARLTQACATAGIRVPTSFLAVDEVRLREIVHVLLRENKREEAVFRYTLTAGVPSRGDHGENFGQPSEFMTLRALPPAAPPEGISLRVLRLGRDNGEWLPRPKSLNYANALAGADELRRRADSASDEGLFLSREERCVVETTRQNIAWVVDGKICYPDAVLGGVEGTCLHWALQLGIPSVPRRAQVDELLGADALFVLNAVRGVTPVRELWDEHDRVCLRTYTSDRHPLVTRLQQQWRDALQATARG